MKHNASPLEVSPTTIPQYCQNRVRYVLRDATTVLGLDNEQVAGLAKVLLARGVCKWLRCRRDIIRAKHEWKGRITEIQAELQDGVTGKRREQLRGELKALIRCREEVRAICHSNRWVLGTDEKDERILTPLLNGAL